MTRALGFLLLFVISIVSGFVGCAPKCEGVDVNGRCETRCDDDACAAGTVCVGNACRKPCDSGKECRATEQCEVRIPDYDSTEHGYCVGPPTGAGSGAACDSNAGCAGAQGFRCVSGACAFTCETHAQCGENGSCTGTAKDASGSAVHLCEKDDFPHEPGHYGTSCPDGIECDCPKGGCTELTEWTCIGAGAGDIDAYCTKRFCEADAECPSGYFCAATRTQATPCEDACGITGDASLKDCVPAGDIGDGKHFSCGPLALVANVCRLREFCSPCKSDADCLGKPNQLCAKDESGERLCTVRCDPDLNSCPWGNAATCGVWDDDVGVATCEHRSGTCHGAGKSCEPCQSERDCEGGWCNRAQFTGEQFCTDVSVSCSCPGGTRATCIGGGCPRSPGGRDMICYGGDAYIDTPLAGACIGATSDSGATSSRESCWPGQ